MADESIAPYISGSIDAGQELRALGLPIARYFMGFLQSIAAGKRPYDIDQPFFVDASGLPAYRVEYADCFIAYVVEKEADGTLMVTLLHADRLAAFASTPQLSVQWDHQALKKARAFVEKRLKDYLQ